MAVDEAVAPAEFVTPRHRLLYQRLFDALCDGRAVSWAGMLADLAADPDAALTDALSAADQELTRLLGDQPTREQLEAVLRDSAHALLEHHRHRRFEEAKAQLSRNPVSDPTGDTPDVPPGQPATPPSNLAQLQALIEERKNLQSPKNIARVQADH